MEKKCILIVDDDEQYIEQKMNYLGQSRFEFHTASSGADALEKVRTLLPDLVLLDMFLEDLSGLQIAKSIRNNGCTSRIPLVLVSSMEKEFSSGEIDLADCDGVIFKPIQREPLVTMVEALLGMISRQWKRASVSIPCIITHQEKETPGTIYSIGSGGVFVEVDRSLTCGDMCSLRFDLPTMERSIEVPSNAVVWKGNADNGNKEGIGLRFLAIEDSDRKVLNEFIGSVLGIDS